MLIIITVPELRDILWLNNKPSVRGKKNELIATILGLVCFVWFFFFFPFPWKGLFVLTFNLSTEEKFKKRTLFILPAPDEIKI